MRFVALVIGKSILKGLQILGRSGSALPGLVIEKIQPKFLNSMLTKLPEGVVVVTGTNGKTTTTKMIVSLLEAHGIRVLTNKTGSNFVRGIVTTVIDKTRLGGSLPYDIAVLEQDEAHAVHFIHQVKPRGVVVLNIMRDQMDRFGEIDTTAQLLAEVVQSATEWVVLNANDERVARLSPGTEVSTKWFGHTESIQEHFLTDDQLHHDDTTKYFSAGKMTTELIRFSENSAIISINRKDVQFKNSLSGSHNVINLTAALAVLNAIIPKADDAITLHAVANLEPAFGRGEVIQLKNGTTVTLQLVKNPGGFTHALRTYSNHYGVVAIAINDDYADGRDVSWLWDVDFRQLTNAKDGVMTGGTRAADMAVRLKYDDISIHSVHPELDDFVHAIHTASESANTASIIFCTYTAMLRIRKLYKKYAYDIYGVHV